VGGLGDDLYGSHSSGGHAHDACVATTWVTIPDCLWRNITIVTNGWTRWKGRPRSLSIAAWRVPGGSASRSFLHPGDQVGEIPGEKLLGDVGGDRIHPEITGCVNRPSASKAERLFSTRPAQSPIRPPSGRAGRAALSTPIKVTAFIESAFLRCGHTFVGWIGW
jgi:hypothetical protein